MKLKRTKLAALALTALMAVGATSLVAYADGTDAPSTTAAVTEATVEFKLQSDGSYVAYYTIGDVTLKSDATVSKTVAQEPTCAKVGYYLLSVTIDGVKYQDTVEIPATGKHTYAEVKKNIVAAGHTTDGSYDLYYVCSGCGQADPNYSGTYEDASTGLVESDITVSATGHTESTAASKTTYMLITDYTGSDYATAEYNNTTYNELMSLIGNYPYTADMVTIKYGNIKVDSDGNMVLGSDGLPQAEYTSEDAYYLKRVECTEGDGYTYYLVKISAVSTSYWTVNIPSDGNITSITVGSTVITTSNDGDATHLTYAEAHAITDADVVLTDCSKTGYYTISTYQDGQWLATSPNISVAAHHNTVTVIEFKSDSDAKLCTVTYNSDGTYKVVNNSCNTDVTYYVSIYCKNSGCTASSSKGIASGHYQDKSKQFNNSYSALTYVSSTTATAAKSADNHSIDTALQKLINADVANETTYAKLDENYNTTQYKSKVSFSNNTSTCLTDGTVDVTYYCVVCGEAAKTETVSVKAPGHEKADAVIEEKVAPSCTTTGSYDVVEYCKNKTLYNCDYEYSRTTTLIPRTAHSNEIEVYTNGTGKNDFYDTNDSTNITIKFTGDVVVDPGDGLYLDLVTVIDVYVHMTANHDPLSAIEYVF